MFARVVAQLVPSWTSLLVNYSYVVSIRPRTGQQLHWNHAQVISSHKKVYMHSREGGHVSGSETRCCADNDESTSKTQPELSRTRGLHGVMIPNRPAMHENGIQCTNGCGARIREAVITLKQPSSTTIYPELSSTTPES
ncbi:hypothetical protein MRX96_057437 [Rhipicephalus microplus]